MNAKVAKQGGSKLWLIIFALLSVIGLACWVLQLTKGLQLTNLDNNNCWGLYIIGFMLFTGIAAGSLIFSSSAYLFQGMAEYKPFTRIAAFVGAIGSVVAAGLFIIVDIGNPERVWNIILSANIESPMFWDTVILAAYVVIGIVFTRQLIMVEQGEKEEKALYGISLVAFIAGLLVTVTSFAFSMQVARPLWNNPVEPLSFLAAALVAALALLIILFAILNKSGYIEISNEKLSKLGKLAGAFLAVELMVVFGEAAIGLYAGAGDEYKILNWLVLGKGAPLFWIELIAIATGVVLLLNKGTLVAGAGVGILAIFMIKYTLLQAQLLNPLLSYPGPEGYVSGQGIYLPSIIEIGLAVGIIALGCLLVMIGLNKLDLGANTNQSLDKHRLGARSEQA